MPTRKQRRRQQKLRRHEYEEVWVDAEGHELPPEAVEELQTTTNGAVRVDGARRREPGTVRTAGGRIVPPPSWGRVFKRALFFAPVMYLLITILPGGDRFTLAQKLVVTVQYMLMLVVFMYLTERLTYRIWRRRQDARADRR